MAAVGSSANRRAAEGGAEAGSTGMALDSGMAAVGPSANGGAAEGGAEAGSPGAVDPAVSKQWSWQKCGAIPPTPLADQAQFLPTGELVISYEDGSVLVHPAGGGPPERQLVAPSPQPGGLFGLSLDGAMLARSSGSSVLVLNTADGSQSHGVAEPPQCANGALQFSAEGDYVFETGGQTTCIWRMADDSLIAEMPGSLSTAAIRAGQLYALDDGPTSNGASPALLAYSLPASPCAATCSAPVQTSRIPLQCPIPGTECTQDGPVLISPRADSVAGATSTIFPAAPIIATALWNLDGSLAYSSATPLSGSTSIASPPPGSILYSIPGDRLVLVDRVVNVSTATAELQLSDQAVKDAQDGQGGTVALDNGGQVLAAVLVGLRTGGQVALYDLPSGRTVQVVGAMPSMSSAPQPTDIAVSEDGTRLALASDWSPLWRIDPEFAKSNILSIDRGYTVDVRFSADGSEELLSGETFLLNRADTGEGVQWGPALPASVPVECGVSGARLSPQGDRLLSVEYDPTARVTTVQVLDIKSDQLITQLPTSFCNARAAYSQDGTLVATSDPRLFRASDWSTAWTATNVLSRVSSEYEDDVQFRPNANEILVSHCADSGNQLHALYSLADGSMLRLLPEIQSIRAKFSPEGNWVVSGATLLHLPDGEQRILDAQSVLATFAPNGDAIALLADGSLARYCKMN
jgi:WD40 repeat protein